MLFFRKLCILVFQFFSILPIQRIDQNSYFPILWLLGGEPIKVDEYYETGQVTEFRYCIKVGEGVKNGFFNLPNFYDPVSIKVIKLGNDTFGSPFFKRSWKISHPSQDALPSFATSLQSVEIGLWVGIFYFKNHPNLSVFFPLKNKSLGPQIFENDFC